MTVGAVTDNIQLATTDDWSCTVIYTVNDILFVAIT